MRRGVLFIAISLSGAFVVSETTEATQAQVFFWRDARGQAHYENDAALNALFDAANRDPRMKQIYLDYLAGWKQAGGELFVHFNDVSRCNKWGRWGAIEYIAQPRSNAPKFDAVQTFIEQNPVWWAQ